MNLLPLVEKRKIVAEYHKRLAVVSLSLLALLFFAVSVSFLALYAVSSREIEALKQELATVSSAKGTGDAIQGALAIEDVNKKMDILSKKSAQDLGRDLSSIWSRVMSSAVKTRLTSFIHDQTIIKKGQTREMGHRLIIGGVAEDRDSLRAFVKGLESNTDFKSVDLPVSNLIASKNIEFTITIMVAAK